MDAARLRPSPLFEGLSNEDLERCADRFEEREVLAGSGVAKEGDFSYKFFVVLDGEIDVLRDFDLVARLGVGDFFGEMGAGADQPRNARLAAHTRCNLAVMMVWDFKTMMEELPVVASRIDAKVAERMASVPNSET